MQTRFLVMTLLASYGAAAAAADSPPAAASSAGYTVNTLHSEFANDVDLNDSKGSNFNWYAGKWFTWGPQPASTIKLSPGQGITLMDGGKTANYTIGSATQSKSAAPQHWVGTAYGGGGYFEAEIKFDPSMVDAPSADGFPAWWLEPVEHLADPRTDQWMGEAPGYEHFVEVDIFEYNQQRRLGPSPSAYSGATHEWYGQYNSTCKGFCKVSNLNNLTRFNNFLINVPKGTNFNQFHKYGLLWVPATKSSDGYAQYFFDGAPTDDKISWKMFTDQKGPPGPQADWTFGVLDRMHMVLVLGTGTSQPLNIRSVNVWQKSASGNLHH